MKRFPKLRQSAGMPYIMNFLGGLGGGTGMVQLQIHVSMDICRLTEPILLSNINTVDYKRRPLLPSSGINVIPLPLGLSR